MFKFSEVSGKDRIKLPKYIFSCAGTLYFNLLFFLCVKVWTKLYKTKLTEPDRRPPNQTKVNQTEPNQTKSNQTK